MNLPKEKVLVAMSGGINSSTTAVLLKTQGFDVAGVYFQFRGPNTEKFESTCCMTPDQQGKGRLKAICDAIGISLHVVHAESEFENKVVDYAVHESLRNHVPNPCVLCNSEIKFKLLKEKADVLGCQWFATGHYGHISKDTVSGIAHLLRAADAARDESYFLFSLTQSVLQRLLLPLGSLTGHMVDRIAEKFNFKLPLKDMKRKICFINEPGFKSFMENRVAPSLRISSTVRNMEGIPIGEHTGLFQHRLGDPSFLPNPNQANNPLFVVGFDLSSQALIIGGAPLLLQSELQAEKVSWVRPIDLLHSFRCVAKLGPVLEEYPCQVTCFENQRVLVEFDEPLRAISKGRAIVFYQDDEVLGGGYVDIFGKKEHLEAISSP